MHSSIRSALAFNLKAIISQKLLPSIVEGVSRVPAVEVMTFNPTVRKLILDAEDSRLPDAIRNGKVDGMQDYTMSLQKLVEEEMVEQQVALDAAPNVEALKLALKGIKVSQSGMV
jgi:twitching motility protein PilT